MSTLDNVKVILGRKASIYKKRDLDISLGEIARELGCTSSNVLSALKQLEYRKEIKRLIPLGMTGDEYTLTIMEKSSILND